MKHSKEDIEKEAYQIYKKKLQFGIPEGRANNAQVNWKEAEEKLRLQDMIHRGPVGQ